MDGAFPFFSVDFTVVQEEDVDQRQVSDLMEWVDQAHD